MSALPGDDALLAANPARTMLFRALIVGGMAGALTAALTGVVQLILDGWQPAFLVLWCGVAAAAAQWSYWLLWVRLPHRVDKLWFRVVELGTLLILGHVGDTLLGGPAGGQTGLIAVSGRTAVVVVLVLFAWSSSAAAAVDLSRLGEPPTPNSDEGLPLETLTGRFLGGGALLLAAVGLSQVELRRLLDTTRPPVTGLILTVLVYFALGMVLLTQAQYTLHWRRWGEEGVAVAAGLGGRWMRYSLLFMGAIALLAFALPTAWSGGLLDLLALLLQALIWFFALLGFGAVAPLIWLLSLISGGTSGTSSLPAAAPPSPPPPPPVESGSPVLDVLRWLLFAGLAVAFAVWLVRGWLANRDDLRAGLGRFRLLPLLRSLLAGLLQRLRGYASAIGDRLPRRLTGRGTVTGAAAGPRFPRLRANSPREQVIRYYLSLIQRASAQGYPRRPAQTPGEYRAALGPHLPEAQPDLAALTDAFVEARYSRHEIAPLQSKAARTRWERVRDALRVRQRQEAEDNQAEKRT